MAVEAKVTCELLAVTYIIKKDWFCARVRPRAAALASRNGRYVTVQRRLDALAAEKIVYPLY